MKEKTVKIAIKTALKESNIDDEDLVEEVLSLIHI